MVCLETRVVWSPKTSIFFYLELLLSGESYRQLVSRSKGLTRNFSGCAPYICFEKRELKGKWRADIEK